MCQLYMKKTGKNDYNKAYCNKMTEMVKSYKIVL